MSTTARHKRPGGFRKLVQSLETTPPERRTKIIAALRAEDPGLAVHAEESIFTFEEFITVPDMTLCELMDAFKAESRILALALYHTDVKLVERFKKNMPAPVAREYREWEESLEKVADNERTSAQYRIITKAREMEYAAKITLKKLHGNYP